MTIEQAFLALLGSCCGVLGWFANQLYQAVQKLQADISKLEVRISADYVRYDRLQDALRPVMTKLDRIEEVLAHKADK